MKYSVGSDRFQTRKKTFLFVLLARDDTTELFRQSLLIVKDPQHVSVSAEFFNFERDNYQANNKLRYFSLSCLSKEILMVLSLH